MKCPDCKGRGRKFTKEAIDWICPSCNGTGTKERDNKMKSEIVVILDRSGSMQTIATDAIGGFNRFIEEQKKVDGECSVTLVQFDDRYETVFENIPLSEVRPLTSETFIPRGMTALNDAIGKTIDMVAKRHTCAECNKNTKTIYAILTDGQENCSHQFNTAGINDKISHARDEHGCEFIFLAANQDAFATGMQLGISANDTFNYTADAVGTQQAFRNMSINTTSYRTGSNTSEKDAD